MAALRRAAARRDRHRRRVAAARAALHVCLSQRELDARARADRRAVRAAGLRALRRRGPRPRGRGSAAAGAWDPTSPAARGARWTATATRCGCCARCMRRLRGAGVARARRASAWRRSSPAPDGFALHTAHGRIDCERVVLAAGLGNARLAPMVGLARPVTPNKGQIIALERVRAVPAVAARDASARPTKAPC